MAAAHGVHRLGGVAAARADRRGERREHLGDGRRGRARRPVRHGTGRRRRRTRRASRAPRHGGRRPGEPGHRSPVRHTPHRRAGDDAGAGMGHDEADVLVRALHEPERDRPYRVHRARRCGSTTRATPTSCCSPTASRPGPAPTRCARCGRASTTPSSGPRHERDRRVGARARASGPRPRRPLRGLLLGRIPHGRDRSGAAGALGAHRRQPVRHGAPDERDLPRLARRAVRVRLGQRSLRAPRRAGGRPGAPRGHRDGDRVRDRAAADARRRHRLRHRLRRVLAVGQRDDVGARAGAARVRGEPGQHVLRRRRGRRPARRQRAAAADRRGAAGALDGRRPPRRRRGRGADRAAGSTAGVSRRRAGDRRRLRRSVRHRCAIRCCWPAASS